MIKGMLVFGVSAVLLPLTFISGCKVGPDYVPPEPNVPAAWRAAETAASEPNTLQQWWLVFNDPLLTDLIETAALTNPDLRAAMFRIAESRAIRAATAGQYAPAVDATGFYSRSRDSENTRMGGAFPAEEYNFHSVGVDAAWEIDLFGRIGRSVESAQAAYEASIEDWRSVQTALFAEVARNYIELRSAQERIRYARSNVKIQQQTLDLTQGRFNADLVPKSDVSQAQLNLANTESEIPLLIIAEAAAINRLETLLGPIPDALRARLRQEAQLPQAPVNIDAGIPADILRQRPDIRQAERTLAAQTALVGAETANLYPSFSLAGTFNLQATDLDDMGEWSSRSYSFGPGFRWNLFDGNRIRSLVQAQEARTGQLLAGYESTVLRAVEEVENAMISLVQQRYRLEALKRSVAAAEESVLLLDALYKNGLTDFENVLVTQRALAIQQDRLVVSRSELLQAAVGLYKALGGGWTFETETPDAVEPASTTTVNSNERP